MSDPLPNMASAPTAALGRPTLAPARVPAWAGPADRVRPKKRREAATRAKLAINASQRQGAKLLAGRRRERLSLYRAVGFSFLRVRQAEEVLAMSIAALLDLDAKGCAVMLSQVYDGGGAATQLLLDRLRQESKLSDSAARLLQEFVVQRSWLMRGLLAGADEDAVPVSGSKASAEGEQSFGGLVSRVAEVGQCAAHIKSEFTAILSPHRAGKPRSGSRQPR
jgi:hypothetical protein